MKVLQINSVYGIGSTGRIAKDLNDLLIDKGHESYVAYGRESITEDDNVIRIGSKLDNYFHVAVTRLLDRHGFASKKATVEFTKKIDEINPDIVHLHNIHGYYINIKILFDYLKENNKKIVWTLHDCWPFTGHCSYFSYVNCNKWKTQCKNCPQKGSYPSSLLIDNSKKNFLEKKEIFNGLDDNLIIVTPSNWLANLVKNSFLKNYKTLVINNGIDLEQFKPFESDFLRKNGLENKFIILGIASTWNKRKGFKFFLKLSEKLNGKQHIIMVGLTSEQINDLPPNITGIQRTNNIKELVEIYSSSDVFLNPTLEDNFPTTNLESLACGTPVITFNTGGSIESVDSKTGFIVEKGNLTKVQEILDKLLNKNDIISSHNCRKRAKDLYNKEDRYEEYIDLYNKYN